MGATETASEADVEEAVEDAKPVAETDSGEAAGRTIPLRNFSGAAAVEARQGQHTEAGTDDMLLPACIRQHWPLKSSMRTVNTLPSEHETGCTR